MKIKTVSTLLLLLPFLSYSDINSIKEERMKILSELGLPLPDSGIQLVPRAMLDLPPDVLKQGALEEEEIKNKGYVEDDSTRPTELLNFRSHARAFHEQI